MITYPPSEAYSEISHVVTDRKFESRECTMWVDGMLDV